MMFTPFIIAMQIVLLRTNSLLSANKTSIWEHSNELNVTALVSILGNISKIADNDVNLDTRLNCAKLLHHRISNEVREVYRHASSFCNYSNIPELSQILRKYSNGYNTWKDCRSIFFSEIPIHANNNRCECYLKYLYNSCKMNSNKSFTINFSTTEKRIAHNRHESYKKKITPTQMETDAKMAPIDNYQNISVFLPPARKPNKSTFVSDDSAVDLHLITKRLKKHCQEVSKREKNNNFRNLLQSTGTFSDLKYLQNDWGTLKQHWRRLMVITSHDLEVDGFLAENTLKSFHFLAYDTPKLTNKNWWIHIIGIPQKAYPAIYLAKDFLSNETMNCLLDRYFTNTLEGSVWNTTFNSGHNSGGNFAPRALVGIVEGLLRNNLDNIIPVMKAALHNELVEMNAWKGNGLREDGCLHHHSLRKIFKDKEGVEHEVILSHIYENNYGKEFFQKLALVTWVVSGTRFNFGKEIEQSLLWAFFSCHQWLYRGHIVEPTTTGRFIDSGNVVTYFGGLHGVKIPLLYLKKLKQRTFEVNAAIHRYENVVPKNKYALEGNRHFFRSDLMAHQRKSFMAAIRLLSKRSLRPETWQSHNSKGYYQGDGFLSVVVSGKEFGSPNREIFQVYNWAFVPGVTCPAYVPQVETSDIKNFEHSYNNSTFVGGVSNGMNGLAAMKYRRLTTSVTANKSWHFFGRFIVAIGTGITGMGFHLDENISTTLNQVYFRRQYDVGLGKWSMTYRSKVNHSTSWNATKNKVLWIHHDKIGYILMKFKQLHIAIEMRNHSKTHIPLFRAWIDHGTNPQNDYYSYVILPGFTVKQTQHFNVENEIQIIEQSNHQHSVCFEKRQISVSFFKAGCIDLHKCFASNSILVCTNEPILLLLDITDVPDSSLNIYSMCESISSDRKILRNGSLLQNDSFNHIEIRSLLRVSISDPTQELKSVKISLETQGYERNEQFRLPIYPYSGISCYAIYHLML